MRFWPEWRRYSLGFLFFVLVLLLVAGRLSMFQTSYYTAKLYETNLLWLITGSELQQEFTAHYPGLDQVDVFVAKRAENSQAEVIFSLRQSCQTKTDLYRLVATQPSGEIDGASFYSFAFAPIEESANQKFCFILTAGASANNKNKLMILASDTDVYPEGEAIYHPPSNLDASETLPPWPPAFTHAVFLPILRKAEAHYHNIDVGFQLHYDGRFLAMLKAFTARLIEDKPYFFGSPGFYVFWLIFYGAGILLLIWLVMSRKILN